MTRLKKKVLAILAFGLPGKSENPSRLSLPLQRLLIKGILAAPPKATPPRNKGLIAGLLKGNQWLISPDHKAGYFWGKRSFGGGSWPR